MRTFGSMRIANLRFDTEDLLEIYMEVSMKYFFLSLAILIVIVSGCVVLGGRISAEGDVFEGTGQGYRGAITVQVRINGADITEINVIDSIEDKLIGGAAMEELIDMVIMYNSTDIDAVSGATETSRGFLEAVENAIMKR